MNPERSNADKVLRRFANQIKPLGFIRTKPTFFVRESDLVIEFIHVHKYSFGPYFRIHVCFRVLNDSKDSVVLSGPTDREISARSKFEFENEIESVEACAKEMSRFIKVEVENWYHQWSDRRKLLEENSPLYDREKVCLEKAINGNSSSENEQLSRQLLKIT